MSLIFYVDILFYSECQDVYDISMQISLIVYLIFLARLLSYFRCCLMQEIAV